MSGENTAGCGGQIRPALEITTPLSLLVQTAETESIYFPNTCFSISTCILLPFEVPKPHSQYPPFVFFFFYWGIVALQCRSSFFCTMKGISLRIHISPPLKPPSHPPLPCCAPAYSLHPHLYFCPRNRFTCTIFLDFTSMH